MPLNIVKLCVGAHSIEDLSAWQDERVREQAARGETARIFHATLQTPKRREELLAGGSLYWVIKGAIQVRQRLIGFEDGAKEDGSPCCHILLDRALVAVRPMPRRAFQGWRYLSGEDAPPDLDVGRGAQAGELPAAMRTALIELGLI